VIKCLNVVSLLTRINIIGIREGKGEKD
jgi:hypothetical protein